MPDKRNYTGYLLIAMVLLLLLWLLCKSRQRTREIDKALRETIVKK